MLVLGSAAAAVRMHAHMVLRPRCPGDDPSERVFKGVNLTQHPILLQSLPLTAYYDKSKAMVAVCITEPAGALSAARCHRSKHASSAGEARTLQDAGLCTQLLMSSSAGVTMLISLPVRITGCRELSALYGLSQASA